MVNNKIRFSSRKHAYDREYQRRFREKNKDVTRQRCRAAYAKLPKEIAKKKNHFRYIKYKMQKRLTPLIQKKLFELGLLK